jgi:GNAT superfamily N-acetyltransferase
MASSRIRPAAPDDLDELVRVHLAAFRAGNGPALSDEALARLTPEADRDAWDPVLRAPPDRARVLVAEADGGLVGVAGAGPSRDHDAGEPVGELYALYVDPAAWGAGHGAALHDAALAHLRDGGFREATLWVLEGNARAREFYGTHGWADDGARGEFWGAVKVRMRRPLR